MRTQSAALSVILVADHFDTIRRVVHCLRDQTARDRIELVILSPDGARFGADPLELTGFAAVQLLEAQVIEPFTMARAMGVRAATAPLIVIGETHSYPHPGWAEALIAAHELPWAAIAPGFGNANPIGALSWAIFLLDYGRWLTGLRPGEISLAPTHNVAYKRAVLLELGAKLDAALGHGEELTLHFRTWGHRAYFEPAARIDHLNITRPRAWLNERFLGGRLIAGHRSRRWTWPRRFLYFAGSPLIPAVVLSRIRRGVRRARCETRLPGGTMPAILLGALVSAIGEAVGYALGVGPAAESQMTEYELHKACYASQPTG
ncbi:MAG TPA: hypothetical protein VFH40_13375 [Gemmatimonadales bacterium]|nr:hypothetical protein [Gemmatimonadales bacterium]